MYDREISSRTKPSTCVCFSAMFLPQSNDCSRLAIMATPNVIVFTYACGYYSRAATTRGAASIQINMVLRTLILTDEITLG